MDELWHYGTPHEGMTPHSGRYKYGSGENPGQRYENLYMQVQNMRSDGKSDKEIRDALEMNSTELRALYSISREKVVAERDNRIMVLHERGWSNMAIAREMGTSEGTVRNVLNGTAKNKDASRQLADVLKAQLEEKPYLDVGKGVELQLGVNSTRKKTALAMLEQEGYHIHKIEVPQATNPTQKTHIEVLTKEDVTKQEVKEHQAQITSPGGVFFEDFGTMKRDIKPPVNIDSDRIFIRYKDDGGDDRDGTIEIRPGVQDLYLGNNSHYAQVRIAVDGTHYLKGMAVYSKDVPEGKDIIFNTNKPEGTPKEKVFKDLKDTEENPFGAVTRQWNYIDADGKEHQSPINIVNDDESWGKWQKSLSSQFLSKQPPSLAKKQLDITYKQAEDEFKEICALTNPTVKKKLLESFADDCDSAAVDLKAAAFPRQATHVILPVPSLKDNEVYAPNYIQGEEVVLVRYPHGGIFEIPRLKVNNDNPEAREVIGNAQHAIGINKHVADQLSGADFDGDTVVVIPTKGINIKTMNGLKGLEGFDPKQRYAAYPGMPKVGPENKFHKQMEMGSVSNLITDMTIKGADWDEIAAADRHSMVIIDAEKHNLNWQQSAIDNHIAELKERYQGGANAGASTLISKASSEARPMERKEIKALYRMTPEQKEAYARGEKVYEYTGRFKVDRYVDGMPIKKYMKEHGITNDAFIPKEKIEYRQTNKLATGSGSTKMAEAKDAFELATGGSRETAYRIEQIYGDYANKQKELARQARIELQNTGNLKYSKEARAAYADERASLIAQMQRCIMNAPLERQAQLIANTNFKNAKRAHPEWDKDDEKKYRQIYINQARNTVQAVSRKQLSVKISPREWDAIQAGAISENTLREILRFANLDEVRRYATPRPQTGLTNAQRARARTLLRNGHTQAEVAEALGVSTSTLFRELNGAAS